MDFVKFQKIPRLSRDMVITEKIDGTNAQVKIQSMDIGEDVEPLIVVGDFGIWAGSRKRYITPENDNYGFATWVLNHGPELVELGEGLHFGEWWGAGIQRRYGLTEKRFSLFNRGRWSEDNIPDCCNVVPILHVGPFDTAIVNRVMNRLYIEGSVAAPGFMKLEGVVVYHKASGHLYKKTFENDEGKQ